MFTRPTRCPNPDCRFHGGPEGAEEMYGTSRFWIKMGCYRRRIDRRAVPRYRCRSCGKSFSSQTNQPSYRESRPDVNGIVFRLLCSGVTIRRTALLVGVHRDTVMGKMRRMADRARSIHDGRLHGGEIRTSHIQFDELQTFKHTRLKPVSVAVAIRAKTGEIIDIDVAMMSPSGTTARLARERYPHWREARQGARESVFRSIGKCAKPGAAIRTDACDHYPPIARRFALGATVIPYMSPGNPENPATGGFNPMFKLDHLFATLRQDLSRLGRSTWATTKTLTGLLNHLFLYMAWRNRYDVA